MSKKYLIYCNNFIFREKKMRNVFYLMREICSFLRRKNVRREEITKYLSNKKIAKHQLVLFTILKENLANKRKLLEDFVGRKSRSYMKNILLEWRIISFIICERKNKYLNLSHYIRMKTKYKFLKQWYLAFDRAKRHEIFFLKQRKAKLQLFLQLWKDNSCQKRALKEFLYSKRLKTMQNLFFSLRNIINMKKEKKLFYQMSFRQIILRKYLRILKNAIISQMKINDFVRNSYLLIQIIFLLNRKDCRIIKKMSFLFMF